MVGSVLDPARDGCISGSAARLVVFKAAVFRRIMRRRDDDAVREICRPAEVESEDGVRDRRRRRVAVIAVDHGVYAICCEHLEGSRESRLRQRMRVSSDVERAAGALTRAVIADRLRDREHVRLIERAAQGRAAMPAGAEGDPLRAVREVGLARVVFSLQAAGIDQQVVRSRLAGERMDRHRYHGPCGMVPDDPSSASARRTTDRGCTT